MAIMSIQPNGEKGRIPQGSNNPLVIEFEEEPGAPVLAISLWGDGRGQAEKPLKVWKTEDVTVDGRTIVCPLTEEETAGFPPSGVTLEIKGLDENGYTIFWEQMNVRVVARRDRIILLTGDE